MTGGGGGGAEKAGRPVFVFEDGRLRPGRKTPVAEYPVSLTVNGAPLATLIASPHDLASLVAGFLRMQGLVRSRDDILVLSVCPDFGAATVRIRGEVPANLTPVLTSGCGGGLSLRLPGEGVDAPGSSPGEAEGGSGSGPRREGIYTAGEIFATMDALARFAERYRESGGIHSAAAGDGRSLLVCAEDIGRHNAVDRVAGEALLKGIDLRGAILATSGRVSSEMAAKAAALGASVVVSRTSPTDLAVRICDERGIALAGYLRGRRFTVYSHPWRILGDGDGGGIAGVTGVILAGGASRRMGRNKALLPWEEGTLIEAVYRRMVPLFPEILLVTNEPDLFDFLACRKVPDLFPGAGSLAGIHAGLRHAPDDHVFVAACDMPHLSGEVIRYLASLREGYDAVIAESDGGIEPLCALYGKGALKAIEEALSAGRMKIADLLVGVRTRVVPRDEIGRIDRGFRSFRNVNTPGEYAALTGDDAALPDLSGAAREGGPGAAPPEGRG